MGAFRNPRYVVRVNVHVTEAFNSDGGDTLVIGHPDNTDGYGESVDVSSTGVKTVTLGSDIGYDATNREVQAVYSNGGTEPTTGKAYIVIEFMPSPPQP